MQRSGPARRRAMSYADPLDAIDGAKSEADEAGHDLRGFTRRTGSFGYRFEARCHTCRETVTVARVNAGWDYSRPIDSCATEAS
ncbi:MAG: hypothetical protein DLM65_02205 [Candidatus Aeolococcus gillhamiae]|uniref:Uncharacterized protein n=1 Tax=Candidatus Aeolococcus gillhamiae TaxID=3127015 RepID=A0A2W5ZHC2_9BACT|nr:MAG: hypothetical protein DLM65_02205 [Candidatus Dormibacter sp. RRmetagenome_bin12]